MHCKYVVTLYLVFCDALPPVKRLENQLVVANFLFSAQLSAKLETSFGIKSSLLQNSAKSGHSKQRNC